MEQTRVRSRRESNKIATRGRILAAAKTLFAARGVIGTTVDDLAEHAEVSRATFFNYFPTKDAVLAALWSDQMDRLTTEIDELLSQAGPTPERIRLLCDSVAGAAEREPGYLKAVTGELEVGFAAPEISGPRVDRFHALLVRLIKAGVSQGDVRVDYEPMFLAQMVAAVFISVLRTWRLDPGYDLATEFAAAARFVSDAIAVPAAV